jgi:hypothetical protein
MPPKPKPGLTFSMHFYGMNDKGGGKLAQTKSELVTRTAGTLAFLRRLWSGLFTHHSLLVFSIAQIGNRLFGGESFELHDG